MQPLLHVVMQQRQRSIAPESMIGVKVQSLRRSARAFHWISGAGNSFTASSSSYVRTYTRADELETPREALADPSVVFIKNQKSVIA